MREDTGTAAADWYRPLQPTPDALCELASKQEQLLTQQRLTPARVDAVFASCRANPYLTWPVLPFSGWVADEHITVVAQIRFSLSASTR